MMALKISVRYRFENFSPFDLIKEKKVIEIIREENSNHLFLFSIRPFSFDKEKKNHSSNILKPRNSNILDSIDLKFFCFTSKNSSVSYTSPAKTKKSCHHITSHSFLKDS